MIAPVETSYGGRLYRSRTEARWAIFFDVAGIPFQYEPEGYALPTGWYLPDFLLTDFKMFCEVKGADPSPEEDARCAALSIATQKDVLIAIGAPAGTFQIKWFRGGVERPGLFGFGEDDVHRRGFWLFNDNEAYAIGPFDGPSKPHGPVIGRAIDQAWQAAVSERFSDLPRGFRFPRAERGDPSNARPAIAPQTAPGPGNGPTGLDQAAAGLGALALRIGRVWGSRAMLVKNAPS